MQNDQARLASQMHTASQLNQAQVKARQEIVPKNRNKPKETKKPEEKLAGPMFWFVFAVNSVKELSDILLDFTVVLVFIIPITTIIVSSGTFLYLFLKGSGTKKKIISVIADFGLETATAGAAPAMPIILLILKYSEKYKNPIKKIANKLKK